VQLPLNANEDLIQVPLVARPGSTPAQFIGEARTELEAPSPDTLVGDDYAALGEDQLDIPKAEAEHVVEPDRVADQLGWKAVAIVRVGRLLHSIILAQAAAGRQLGCEPG
jgi:hypothetical protein